ncbi:hypothetical protein [Streptococcus suis]|uniref:hypothetical protein n=1 Tax=Streptococcus suis TaxID=1307 RepID=UPI00155197CE|nr:hypothetical protein [Streptococcus suis]MBM7192360.1 hypothetical protein [Streptococcus suis]MCO8224498.1 hypothetical protein [Streptococcus suis]NQN35756.1 hypothetical protein [Streptococcus suis]HEM3485151.1 hypothetical protein [Streptococcus suis]HEM6495740.1 hypothetical protein [Streptococcus suis]
MISKINLSTYFKVIYSSSSRKIKSQVSFLNEVIKPILSFKCLSNLVFEIPQDNTGKSTASLIFSGKKSKLLSYINGIVSSDIKLMVTEIERLKEGIELYVSHKSYGIDKSKVILDLKAAVRLDNAFKEVVGNEAYNKLIKTDSDDFLALLLYVLILITYDVDISRNFLNNQIKFKYSEIEHTEIRYVVPYKDYSQNIADFIKDELIITNFWNIEARNRSSTFYDNRDFYFGINKLQILRLYLGDRLPNDFLSEAKHLMRSELQTSTILWNYLTCVLPGASLKNLPIIQRGFINHQFSIDNFHLSIVEDIDKCKHFQLAIGCFYSIKELIDELLSIRYSDMRIIDIVIEVPSNNVMEDLLFNEKHCLKKMGIKKYSEVIGTEIYNSEKYVKFLKEAYTEYLSRRFNNCEFYIDYRVSKSNSLTHSHILWCLIGY